MANLPIAPSDIPGLVDSEVDRLVPVVNAAVSSNWNSPAPAGVLLVSLYRAVDAVADWQRDVADALATAFITAGWSASASVGPDPGNRDRLLLVSLAVAKP